MPEEVWTNQPAPDAVPLRAHEPQPFIEVYRMDYGGDPELPQIAIRIVRSVQHAA